MAVNIRGRCGAGLKTTRLVGKPCSEDPRQRLWIPCNLRSAFTDKLARSSRVSMPWAEDDRAPRCRRLQHGVQSTTVKASSDKGH